jgi:hypothetical protein
MPPARSSVGGSLMLGEVSMARSIAEINRALSLLPLLSAVFRLSLRESR